jgi:hypothetical protein
VSTADPPPTRAAGPADESTIGRPVVYLRVVLIEAAVLVALWAFSRYFG